MGIPKLVFPFFLPVVRKYIRFGRY